MGERRAVFVLRVWQEEAESSEHALERPTLRGSVTPVGAPAGAERYFSDLAALPALIAELSDTPSGDREQPSIGPRESEGDRD